MGDILMSSYNDIQPNMALSLNEIKAMREGKNLEAIIDMLNLGKPSEDLTAEDLKNAREGKPDEMLKKLQAHHGQMNR